jgi:hypothetical protein
LQNRHGTPRSLSAQDTLKASSESWPGSYSTARAMRLSVMYVTMLRDGLTKGQSIEK